MKEIMPDVQILEVIDTVKDSIAWFDSHVMPDIVFMDIQLADGLSFEIFEEIEISSPIIFTTAFDQYAVKAFEVNSVHYLLKPIDKGLLEKGLKKLSNLRTQPNVDIAELLKSLQDKTKIYKERFLVSFREELLSVSVDDVSCFYTEHGNVYVITDQGKRYPVNYTLDHLEVELNPKQFYRLNRQHIAHIGSITSASVYENGKILIKLKHLKDALIFVSREKSSSFKEWFGS